jgi:glycogen operon protein
MTAENWDDGNARCFGMLLDGRAQESGIRRRGSDATLLTIYNAHFDVVNFSLPPVPEGKEWLGLIDTNQPDERRGQTYAFGEIFSLTGRSLAVFGLATAEDQLNRSLRHGMGSMMEAIERPLPSEG